MGVHYGKTHAFVVGSKHMTSANEGISVTINEHSTESDSAQKHLGITMERHNWHLILNIDKHTTSYNIYCPYFFIRSILNIICDSLNTLCCSFLITRSGFVIMRCRSCKWCSSLIITCCAFINCRATCYFMYSRYNIIRSTPFIIRCSKFITCCSYIFQ